MYTLDKQDLEVLIDGYKNKHQTIGMIGISNLTNEEKIRLEELYSAAAQKVYQFESMLRKIITGD